MNARIDMYSPEEVAKSVGVSSATICNWCRDGIINCNNVSDGTDRSRYEIDEEEYRYLRDLSRKYGPKKVLLYYKKSWQDEPLKHMRTKIDPDREYTSAEAAVYLKVNHDGFNKHCKKGDFNCRIGKTNRKGYMAYYIPGWELLYIKSLYDKYGHGGGRKAALTYYVKDRDKREPMNKIADQVTDSMMAYANGEIGIHELELEVKNSEEVIANKTRYKTVHKEEIERVEASEGRKDTTPKRWPLKTTEDMDDDKILNHIIRIKDLKRDIEDYEIKLNQMRNEYNQLREEIVGWL